MSEIISEYDQFLPSLKPGERTTTLKMCIDAVISKYGADIFSREYTANKDRFLQVLVNTRNRIVHSKRNQPKNKYLSGPESILYLVKLCHLCRMVLLWLLAGTSSPSPANGKQTGNRLYRCSRSRPAVVWRYGMIQTWTTQFLLCRSNFAPMFG